MPRKSTKSDAPVDSAPDIKPLNDISDIPPNPLAPNKLNKTPDSPISQPDVNPVIEPGIGNGSKPDDFDAWMDKQPAQPDLAPSDPTNTDWIWDGVGDTPDDTSPDLRNTRSTGHPNPFLGIDWNGITGPAGVKVDSDPFRSVRTKITLDQTDPDKPVLDVKQDRQIRPLLAPIDIGKRQKRAW